jgi:hypothetical protein
MEENRGEDNREEEDCPELPSGFTDRTDKPAGERVRGLPPRGPSPSPAGRAGRGRGEARACGELGSVLAGELVHRPDEPAGVEEGQEAVAISARLAGELVHRPASRRDSIVG